MAWGYLKDGQTTHDLLAALSKMTGKHELKIGGEFRLRRFGNGQPGTPAGEFAYDFNGTSQQPWSGGGDAMATFLTGTSNGSWGQYEVPGVSHDPEFSMGRLRAGQLSRERQA